MHKRKLGDHPEGDRKHSTYKRSNLDVLVNAVSQVSVCPVVFAVCIIIIVHDDDGPVWGGTSKSAKQVRRGQVRIHKPPETIENFEPCDENLGIVSGFDNIYHDD